MKRVFQKKPLFIAIGIIIIVSFIFHARLFIPHLQLITTPEFELNDAVQLSYASKYWYWEKLHARELPFWSTHMGAGFPVLGEGQTGIFFLPNLLLYGLSPSAPLAYNLSLVLVTITTALGTFWWLLLLQIPWAIALVSAMTFAGSGFFLFHLQHITLLQSFSLLPLIFVATHQVIKKQRIQDVILFSILFSQQIFAGFIQAVFITAIGSTIYAFFLWKQSGKKIHGVLFLVSSYIIGILLATPQLIPSIEFSRQIVDQSENVGFSSKYSFALKSFLSFLNPFAIGNPKYATYYINSHDEGLLFWETNGFVGILPLVLLTCILFVKKSWGRIKPFFILLCISILLMLGKFSPFYFIYDFFPFTLFRVPARFVILVSFMIIIIGSTLSCYIKKRWITILLSICWIGNLISLLPYWYSYHEWKLPEKITETPTFAKIVSNNSVVYRYHPTWQHRDVYMQYGWVNPDQYTIFQNALRPNTNIFWKVTTFDAYPSRTLSRKQTADQIIKEHIETSADHIATMSAVATNLLTLLGNSSIVSGDMIDSHDIFPLIKKISDGRSTIYLYQLPASIPRVHFVSNIIPVSTITNVIHALSDSNFDPKTTALLERVSTKNQIQLSQSDTLAVIQWSDQRIVVKTSTANETPVILNTTFYPGWIGTIDGKKTTLYPANISSTALLVPAGEHVIKLHYTPMSLIIGILVSVCTLLVILFALLFRKRICFLRKLFPK